MAESDAKHPAINTIAINIVPIASDFLNIFVVLEMSRVPTIRDGLLNLDRILDFIPAVLLDNMRVEKNRKRAIIGMIVAAKNEDAVAERPAIE